MGEGPFRVGVIGTSWWADLEHLPGMRARRDVELVALCGRNPERLAALATKFRVPSTFTDWREMIAKGGPDLLVLATPNPFHHPPLPAPPHAPPPRIFPKTPAMN